MKSRLIGSNRSTDAKRVYDGCFSAAAVINFHEFISLSLF
jgi:hypothetical protein